MQLLDAICTINSCTDCIMLFDHTTIKWDVVLHYIKVFKLFFVMIMCNILLFCFVVSFEFTGNILPL